jgi:hypothetical protein
MTESVMIIASEQEKEQFNEVSGKVSAGLGETDGNTKKDYAFSSVPESGKYC